MRLSLILPLIGLLAAYSAGAMAAAPSPRVVASLDTGWRFHRGDLDVPGIGKPVTSWRWKRDDRGEAAANDLAGSDVKTDGPGWQDAAPRQDVFSGRRGFAWFRTVLPAVAARNPVLSFDSVDDNAVVYLNGRMLVRHEGWDDPFQVPLDMAWRPQGPNVVAVLVQNTDGPGGIGRTMLEGLDEKPSTAAGPLAPSYDDSGWRRVDVPHDYVVEGSFDPKADLGHGFLPVEPAWYRKEISIPTSARGKLLWLEFDGVYRNSRIWLNGQELGRHRSGYTPFRYDVSRVARPGKPNLLVVRVDPTAFEGWWYEGGGIYRHVRLITLDRRHVAPQGVFVTASLPEPRDGLRADATLSVRTDLVNDGDAPDPTMEVSSEVLDAEGRVVAHMDDRHAMPAGGREHLVQTLSLPGASLWSLEQPYLYHLRTTLSHDRKIVDQVSTPFGVRTIRFDPDRGFFLNGRAVKLKGTCNHQDHAGVGIALPDRLIEWRIRKLIEMGSNAYRCSHNPVAEELLDACDRLGMLVMDENRHLGDTYAAKSSPSTPASDLSDLKTMVLRDRNHPSVIMWSLCNEEGIQGTPAGGRIARAMKQVVNELDGTRPVTAAMNGGHGPQEGLSGVVDLEGFNYGPGAYPGYHASHPRQPIYGSETASAVGTRGVYVTDPAKGYVSAYDVNAPPWGQTAENAWRPVGGNPYVAGCFVWTGFDYKGEPTPYGWPCINSHFGIMDICGFPKDAFWYYQSWWTDRPVIHLFPHWNWPGKEGQEIPVWVYSNCERVELFLNGKSLGAHEMKPNGHLEWKVTYEPGTLVARGTRGGKEYTDQVETTGPAARIALSTDRPELDADGNDVSVVAVRLLDEKGRFVATADNPVTFTLRGPGKILGVGNGDPSSHEPDKAMQRHAFNGLCMALVQSGRSRGTITLTAEAPGVKPASLRLDAR